LRVLVTGPTGFVGQAVIDRLLGGGHDVVAATRREPAAHADARVRWQVVGPVDGRTDWNPALSGVDAVIHLVARTHQPGEKAGAYDAYHSVNVLGTRRLAEQARAAGVGRLVFVSSIKAQAERSERPLTEQDLPYPEDVYGQTKLEAERELAAALEGGETAYTVVRPPLVYGVGVRANLRSLTRAVLAGWPLPFARVDNRRSLIGVENLADLLVRAMVHPAAANRLYLAADGIDLSTPDLVRRIAAAGGRRPRLFPVPPAGLAAGARLLGRGTAADRLLSSLRVDASRARRELDWRPPQSIDAGLSAMVTAIQQPER
jgi:nucleoside-diphosphate-sugar epimerase